MMRWFRVLILVSLSFVLVGLFQYDFVRLPEVQSVLSLQLSGLVLVAAIVGQATAWSAYVSATGAKVNWAPCVAGSALSVFSKYVPGKVLVIVARAAYLSKHVDLPLGRLIQHSFGAQVLAIWAAALVGAWSFGGLDLPQFWLLAIAAGWLLVSALVFTPFPHWALTRMATTLGRTAPLPAPLGPQQLLVPAAWSLVYWLTMSLAFWVFVNALTTEQVSAWIGFAFPLAMLAGILALPAPGGLGVTEGALSAILLVSGMPLETAISVAIATRLWLLAGEATFFVLGWLLDRRIRSGAN